MDYLTWSSIYLASGWLIRVAMLIYVPQRRPAAAARAWLLLIFFMPKTGLLLYALVGRIYLPRRRVELQQQASEIIRATQSQLQLTDPHIEALLPDKVRGAISLATELGDFVAVAGNRFDFLADYDGAINRLIGDIGNARATVNLLYYIFADDATGRRVADALRSATRRGVRCRVLMDAVGSRKALHSLAPELRVAGIEVIEMLPVGIFRRNVARFDLRNHRKIAVIDGRIGYSGSQNIVDAWFIPDCPNEELVVRMTGPAVNQLQAVFFADWYFETGVVLAEPDLFPELAPTGTTVTQVLPSGPGYERENTKDLMVALIYAARRSVVIATPYFVPDEPFLQALIVAARRGISVHLVLSRRSEAAVTHLAQQSYYSQLLAAGIHIHLFKNRFLHAKLMTIDDDVALIGSTNIDIRSFALNAEVSLLVYGPEVVSQLHELQERYFAESLSLDLEAWERRPWSAKVLQNTARLADSLL